MKILFMCVANSARSQIAEGLARRILGAGVEVRSAGSQPSGRVHPMAMRVLEESGGAPAGLWSKAIADIEPEFLTTLDYVITLCAEEVCPYLPGDFKRLHWATPDPAAAVTEAEQLAAFRSARDFIAEKLRVFREQMDRPAAAQHRT